MPKVNKSANFWLRLLVKIIDLSLVITIISLSLHFSIDNQNHFTNSFIYYFWGLSSALVMFTITTGVPLITKGSSFGNILTRTKVESKNITRAVIKREIFFGLAWTTMILLIVFIMSPSLFEKIISKGNSGSKTLLSAWESFRFGIVNTVSGVLIFLQLIFGLTLLVKKGGNSFLDNYSHSNVIRLNQFENKKQKKQGSQIKPVLIRDEPINFKKGN